METSVMALIGLISAVIVVVLVANYAKKRSKRIESKMIGNNKLILGIIGSASSRFRWFALLFTADGIILAVTKGAISSMTAGKWAFYSKFDSNARARQLSQMTIEDILHDNKSNLFIPYNLIKSVTLKKGRLFFDPRMIIATDKKKYEYSFALQTFDAVLNMLNEIIPDKLNVSNFDFKSTQLRKTGLESIDKSKSYVEILRERYVKGEITAEEFEKLADKYEGYNR